MAHPELLQKIHSAQPNPETDLPHAIQRYLNGESIQVLAKEMQCSRRVLYKWMLSDVGQEKWADLKRDAMLNRIADADENLETATDPVLIARAREQSRFARMDFERRFPKLYGQKQEITEDKTIRVIIDDRTPLTIRQQGATLGATPLQIDDESEPHQEVS